MSDAWKYKIGDVIKAKPEIEERDLLVIGVEDSAHNRPSFQMKKGQGLWCQPRMLDGKFSSLQSGAIPVHESEVIKKIGEKS